MKRVLGISAALAVASVASSAFGAAAVGYSTVSALDPNDVSAPGVPISSAYLIDASSNGTLGTGVNFSTFSTLVASAYTAGNGGVFNFEAAQVTSGSSTLGAQTGDTVADSITGTLGPLGLRTVGFYRTDGPAPNYLDANGPGAGGGTATAASGTEYLGIGGVASPVPIVFSTGLQDVGLTLLARNATRYVTISAGYSGVSSGSIVSSQETTSNTNQVFFGFQAPVGDLINSITITSTSDAAGTTPAFSRFDDLAVVAAPLPEPTSLGLLAVGGLGLLRRRRQGC